MTHPIQRGRRRAQSANPAGKQRLFMVLGSTLALAGLTAGSTIAEPATPLDPTAAVSAEVRDVQADGAATVDFQRASAVTSMPKDAHGPRTVSSSIEPTKLSKPVASGHLASSFGTRANPLGNTATDFHRGIDYSGSCGTAVISSDDGVVTEAGWHAYGGGQRVVVDHGEGMKTTYNHLGAIGVAVGQKIVRGAGIGAIGNTGNSTGCHLHFEVMVNEDVADPVPFL